MSTAGASRSVPASPTTRSTHELDEDLDYITRLCDQYNIPFATNVASAEMLIMGLARGDLDWRDIVKTNHSPLLP